MPHRSTETTGRARVLLVDDEVSVLEALKRTMRLRFDVVTATSGETGLAAITREGPFAVIVSDMRMPGMDGAEFLAAARRAAPDTVRVLLTGYADTQSAAAAVNLGQIFRFLEKPCPSARVIATLTDAVEYHALITAERELLEVTLRGSVEVLTDVLALVSPVAFARSLRLKRLVVRLADALCVTDRWAIELAAMLSELGSITVPPEVLERAYRGEALNTTEREMMAGAPEIAAQLIAHLPRLDLVREILRLRHADYVGDPHASPRGEAIPIGARLLRIASDYDEHESRGGSTAECLDVMSGRAGAYDPTALAALVGLMAGTEPVNAIREMSIIDVRPGMVFARDVVAQSGLVLIGRGQEVTPSLVRRIHNFWADMSLKESTVLVTSRAAD